MPARLTLALFLIVSACSSVPAGAPTERARAEAAWADLVALAAAPEADAARFAPRVVARGDDDARRWRRPADLSIASEAQSVDAVADRLRRLLARVSTADRFAYTAEAFRTETESEGTWRVLTVRFDDAAGTRVEVGLLPVDGRLLLGDID